MNEDFRYSTDAEIIQAQGEQGGRERPLNQWICTDYDVWVKNPHYHGPEQPHPEYDEEPSDELLAWFEAIEKGETR